MIGRPKESTLALKGLESGGESAVGAAAVAKQVFVHICA